MRLSRRDVVRAGALGLAGLPGLPLLANESAGVGRPKARAKAVIFYHHYGAPSHIDTFDPKPAAPAEIRGEFATIHSSAPGMPVTDIMPGIAKVCDRLAVVHTMSHKTSNHNPGGRDHWPACYSLVLAGAGVKRGYVHGESDRSGEYPRGLSHTPGDMAATLFWALGLDPQTHIHDPLGRPYALADGQPITALFD